MKRKTSQKQGKPNYLDKAISALADAKEAGIHHVFVAHDDWCAMFTGGICNCNPEVSVAIPHREVERRLIELN